MTSNFKSVTKMYLIGGKLVNSSTVILQNAINFVQVVKPLHSQSVKGNLNYKRCPCYFQREISVTTGVLTRAVKICLNLLRPVSGLLKRLRIDPTEARFVFISMGLQT